MGINKDLITSKTARGQHFKETMRKEAKKLAKELSHTFRHLTKAEIAAQYTPERIAALLKRGQQNLKDMRQIIPTEPMG